MPAMNDLDCLVAATLLTWLMLMVASLVRARGWTSDGMRVALGNRDDLPPPTPLAGRADRAAKNMLENLVLFVAVLAAARLAHGPSDRLVLGARIFLGARLGYAVAYLAGVRYLRTALWAIALVGVGIVGAAPPAA